MKKFAALFLALVMILTLTCTAFAESRTFVLTYVTDAEGIDMEVEELPLLIFTIDDETMTCVYSNEEGDEEGTVEILESRPEGENGSPACVTLKVSLAGGDVFEMFVYEDQIEILDEENDICYILLSTEALEALAEAA